MASPGTQVAVGAVESTNATIQVRTVGFKPRTVTLRVGGDEAYWQEGMAAASAHKRVAAGTGSVVTTNGITQQNDGFDIGADADFNPAGAQIIYWRCES